MADRWAYGWLSLSKIQDFEGGFDLLSKSKKSKIFLDAVLAALSLMENFNPQGWGVKGTMEERVVDKNAKNKQMSKDAAVKQEQVDAAKKGQKMDLSKPAPMLPERQQLKLHGVPIDTGGRSDDEEEKEGDSTDDGGDKAKEEAKDTSKGANDKNKTEVSSGREGEEEEEVWAIEETIASSTHDERKLATAESSAEEGVEAILEEGREDRMEDIGRGEVLSLQAQPSPEEWVEIPRGWGGGESTGQGASAVAEGEREKLASVSPEEHTLVRNEVKCAAPPHPTLRRVDRSQSASVSKKGKSVSWHPSVRSPTKKRSPHLPAEKPSVPRTAKRRVRFIARFANRTSPVKRVCSMAPDAVWPEKEPRSDAGSAHAHAPIPSATSLGNLRGRLMCVRGDARD